MNFLRLLLLPFSLVYALIISVRNLLFDLGWKKSYPIPNKSITIGNLAVGGTGKSPLTVYLAELTQNAGKQAVILSRGYGRKTRGYRLANPSDSAATIGDEPFMYYRRFGGAVPVVVSEERKTGVENINRTFENPVILLDDAFQHRKVTAGMQLVLTTFGRPLFSDFTFPAGNLREPRSGLRRADIVLVTKCPPDISPETKRRYIQKLRFPASGVFFSEIVYGKMEPLTAHVWSTPQQIILVSGIANPVPLLEHLEKTCPVELVKFPDHHAFTAADLDEVQRKIDTFASRRPVVVTTEKDAVRLIDLQEHPAMKNHAWFYQSMTVKIDREKDFNDLILKYVTGTNERSS